MQRIIRPENERVKSKMTNKPLLLIALAIGFLATSAPLIAHHGATNVYDFSKPVVLKGTITKFEWLNPHNQIYFDVTDEKGTVSHWIAATEPPQVMIERGWTRRSLKEGTRSPSTSSPRRMAPRLGTCRRSCWPTARN
jgi:hypothetical protein